MSLGMTICFYLLIGIAVTAALWLSRDASAGASDVFQILSAPFFWPIYLPLLLVRRTEQLNDPQGSPLVAGSSTDVDTMTLAIEQVERELDAALQSLDGWAESVLADERHQIAELKNAWRQQADHIRELDELLAQSSMDNLASVEAAQATTEIDSGQSPSLGQGNQDRRGKFTEHERVRSENIVRLRQVRASMFDDLMATVAWVRELVTMIHLAKYTGAPASRAEELVRQIAAAVEGLSEVKRTTSTASA